jgi:hypothetical protein
MLLDVGVMGGYCRLLKQLKLLVVRNLAKDWWKTTETGFNVSGLST